jgi:hypothetical protein
VTPAREIIERSALERELIGGDPRRRDYLRQLTEASDLGGTVELLLGNTLSARQACAKWLDTWKTSHPGVDVTHARRSARYRDLRSYYLGMLDQFAGVLQLVYPPPDEQSRMAAPTWATVVLDRRSPPP